MSGQVGAFALQPSSLPQRPCTQEVDSRGDTALPSGWASLYRSPQHNAGNPADLPSSGGRAGVHLASCLAEWLEWVLGPFLIPSSPACPGRGWRRREKGRAASSQLQAGGWCGPALCGSAYLSRAKCEPSNGAACQHPVGILNPSPSTDLAKSWGCWVYKQGANDGEEELQDPSALELEAPLGIPFPSLILQTGH